MTKSNGIASLKQAAKLLNKHSPDGESLAYINPEEAKLLRSHGGSGIQTLSTVPSYIDWGALAGKILPYGKKLLDFGTQAKDIYDTAKGWFNTDVQAGEPTGLPQGSPGQINPYQQPIGQLPFLTQDMGASQFTGENPFWKDIGGSIMKSGKDFLTGRYGGADAIKNIGTDAMSVWMALRAKKDQEGLNNAEMEQFNKLNQRMEAATAEFTENIAGGGVQNVPTDVSRFTEVDLPDMITTPTAAQGGRIGAFNGGIQGLMPQQGIPQQGFMPQPGFMPQQGLMPPQGLDPRMGYAAQGGRIGYQEAGPVLSEQQITQIKQMAAMGSDISTISSITEATIDQINNILNPPVESEAYGGRIGAQGGGIMPLLDMGGMEKDYRQEGGFVPIGRKEKADDVPARLSKNEFVFTADAVKAAGGGDIDEGAQRMYNVMKNLEAGGEISQQSQGQG